MTAPVRIGKFVGAPVRARTLDGVNYARQRRIELARAAVTKGDRTLSAIALEAGFADQSHFTPVFRKAFGETPGNYARPLRGR